MEQFTREEARDHTDRMRHHLDAGWQMFIEAYQRRADLALGYPSWEAYCNNELGDIRPKLPVNMRRDAVESMTTAQMPTRAQAAVLGVSQRTVVNDQSVEQSCSTEREVVTRDGKVRPVRKKEKQPPETPLESLRKWEKVEQIIADTADEAAGIATEPTNQRPPDLSFFCHAIEEALDELARWDLPDEIIHRLAASGVKINNLTATEQPQGLRIVK
jgi:sirohydrochlorin ferrochelatase